MKWVMSASIEGAGVVLLFGTKQGNRRSRAADHARGSLGPPMTTVRRTRSRPSPSAAAREVGRRNQDQGAGHGIRRRRGFDADFRGRRALQHDRARPRRSGAELSGVRGSRQRLGRRRMAELGQEAPPAALHQGRRRLAAALQRSRFPASPGAMPWRAASLPTRRRAARASSIAVSRVKRRPM